MLVANERVRDFVFLASNEGFEKFVCVACCHDFCGFEKSYGYKKFDMKYEIKHR